MFNAGFNRVSPYEKKDGISVSRMTRHKRYGAARRLGESCYSTILYYLFVIVFILVDNDLFVNQTYQKFTVFLSFSMPHYSPRNLK